MHFLNIYILIESKQTLKKIKKKINTFCTLLISNQAADVCFKVKDMKGFTHSSPLVEVSDIH